MRYLLLATALLVLSSACAEKPPETLTFDVTGMTCKSCVQAITTSLQRVEGVLEVTVDLESETAVVVVEGGTSLETVLDAVPGLYTMTLKKPGGTSGHKSPD